MAFTGGKSTISVTRGGGSSSTRKKKKPDSGKPSTDAPKPSPDKNFKDSPTFKKSQEQQKQSIKPEEPVKPPESGFTPEELGPGGIGQFEPGKETRPEARHCSLRLPL